MHIETTALNDPKCPLTRRGQGYPMYGLLLVRAQISLAWLYGEPFRVTSHVETSTPIDTKMTLNIKRSKLLHIDKQLPPRYQISPHVVLQPARFQVTGHIETKWPKMTLNSEVSKVSHMHITTIPGPKFHSVSLYSQPFSSYRPF